jgi:hypothetical protein
VLAQQGRADRGHPLAERAGPDLAAQQRAAQHVQGERLAGVDQLGAQRLAEILVAQHVGDQPAAGLAERAGQVGRDLAEQGEQVVAQVAGVRGGAVVGHVVPQRVHHQLGPARPAPVERGLAGVRPGGHPLHGQLAVPDVLQLVHGGLMDGLVQGQAAPARLAPVVAGAADAGLGRQLLHPPNHERSLSR